MAAVAAFKAIVADHQVIRPCAITIASEEFTAAVALVVTLTSVSIFLNSNYITSIS